MGDFALQIDIRAPQTEVFEYLADATQTPQWYEAVRSATRVGAGPVAEGARYEFTRELPQGRVVNEVEIAEYEEPTRIAFASRTGPTPFVYRYSVEPTGFGSRVTLEGSITGEGLRGASAILAPFASRFFERGMAKNLEMLKSRLES